MATMADDASGLPRVAFEVDDTKQHDGGFTVYRICLQTHFHLYPNSVIIVWRRYRQVRALYEQLQKAHPELPFPEFPKKTSTGRFKTEVIEERRKLFKQFFDVVAAQPLLYESPELLDFLAEPNAGDETLDSIRAFALGRAYDRIDLKPLIAQAADKAVLLVYMGSSDPHALLVTGYRLARAGIRVKVATLAKYRKLAAAYALDCTIISDFVDVEALKRDTTFSSFLSDADVTPAPPPAADDTSTAKMKRLSLNVQQTSKWLFPGQPPPPTTDDPSSPTSAIASEFDKLASAVDNPAPASPVKTVDGHNVTVAALAASVADDPLALSMLQVIAPRLRTRRLPQRIHPQQLSEIVQAAIDVSADVIVGAQGLPELVALFCISEVSNKRVFGIFQDPVHPTKQFAHSNIYDGKQLAFLNSYTYAECELADWLLSRRVIQFWLNDKRGIAASTDAGKALAPLNFSYWLAWLRGSPTQQPVLSVLYCMSPAAFGRPADWSPAPSPDVCGYVFVEETPAERDGKTTIPSQATLPKGIVTFLNEGPKPVFVGFDVETLRSFSQSMQTHFLGIIIEALQDANMRCVLCLRTAQQDCPAETIALVQATVEHIPAIQFIAVQGTIFPYLWLFRNCACVVHDGTSELLANSLRSGQPVLMLPSSPESKFWAAHVEDMHVGPKSIPLSQITPKSLYSALRLATSDRNLQLAAEALGEHIRAESGPERTLLHILNGLVGHAENDDAPSSPIPMFTLV